MKIKIEVTAEDIVRGRQGECARCPVALALTRSTGSEEVGVGHLHWRAGALTGPLSVKASRFIVRFDEGLSVKPATFELETY